MRNALTPQVTRHASRVKRHATRHATRHAKSCHTSRHATRGLGPEPILRDRVRERDVCRNARACLRACLCACLRACLRACRHMYEAHMPDEKHDELPELLKKCARIQPAWHTATAETSLCDRIAPLILPLLLLHPILWRCISCHTRQDKTRQARQDKTR